MELESRMVVTRDRRKGKMGNYFFNEYRVLVWKDENSFGDG